VPDPTPLPSYDEALERVLRLAPSRADAERIALSSAAGRVVISPICADRDLPPFDRAQLDGYALRAAEYARGRAFPVIAQLSAGARSGEPVPPGACVQIATGAPVPKGLDVVIGHEASDRGNPVTFHIDTVTRGNAVHPRGADARQGAELIAPGTRLGARHLGVIAAIGACEIEVARVPRVAILTSGDEVVPEGVAPAPHQIRNSNGPMLASLVRGTGGAVIFEAHAPDELGATRGLLERALKDADLVLTTGGVSAGDRDHFPAALRELGAALTVHGVRLQPGKPLIAAQVQSGAIVLGLPGNPVSSLVCFTLFAWPLLRALSGASPALPWTTRRLVSETRTNAQRRAFRPARFIETDEVEVPRWSGSGDLAHTAQTDGLVELPLQAEPVRAGTVLRTLPWPA